MILNGVRTVLVATRKGGAGKSTLCRALASAAVARGETVTLFDTDPSQSCRDWMLRAKASGNWSSLIDVVSSSDAETILATVSEIETHPDQEHLILIDTPAGRSDVADGLVNVAHQVVCPMMLSRADLSDARTTAAWYLARTGKGGEADLSARFTVALARVPFRISESERSVATDVFAALPVFETFIANRASYLRMDEAGLIGSLAETLPNRGVASHMRSALEEAEALLAEIDAAIRARR